MSLSDAFAMIDAENKARVIGETWGHLAPVRTQSYEGKMIFANGSYGDHVLLYSTWKGLDDSPWLFNDMTDFMCEKAKDLGEGVFQFDGFYRRDADGEWEFDGSISQSVRW